MLLQESELRKNATCRKLMAAASVEFAKRGYASARVRDIADAAAVNLAAVNYYFGSKEGLYRATLSYLAGQPAPRVGPNRRGTTPEERLHRHVFGLLDRFLGEGAAAILGRILAHEALQPTELLENIIEGTLRPDYERLVEAIADVSGGVLPDDEVAQVALGVLGQCLLHPFARPAIERIHPGLPQGVALCRQLARHITDMTLAGVAALQVRQAAGNP